MGKLKDKPINDTKPAKASAVAKAADGEAASGKLTYALKSYSAERRPDGWWISKTPFTTAGEKPSWTGPLPTIEDACLAIARYLAIEIANRHSIHIASLGLSPKDPLFGLKPTTKLDPPGSSLA